MRKFRNQDGATRVFDARTLGKLAQHDFQAFFEEKIQQHRKPAQIL